MTPSEIKLKKRGFSKRSRNERTAIPNFEANTPALNRERILKMDVQATYQVKGDIWKKHSQKKN